MKCEWCRELDASVSVMDGKRVAQVCRWCDEKLRAEIDKQRAAKLAKKKEREAKKWK